MKHLLQLSRWLVLILAVLALNFPVLTTLATSLKSRGEIASNPTLWIHAPTLANYIHVLGTGASYNVWLYLWNSLVISLLGTLLPMAICFPAAWAAARHDVGRRLLMPLVVNLRALPLIIFAIPLYLMYQAVGLLDTQLGLGLILSVVNLPLALLIQINAIRALPLELEEAARMDGASLGGLLWRVVLPLCRPAMVTVFIFGFITAWNEFLFGLMLSTRDAVPVTVGASLFFASSGGGVNWGNAAAIIVISALPPVLLGTFMYKHIGGSMTSGALKG